MKKKILTLSVIIAIDVLLCVCWIFYINPDPSISIYLALVLPSLFLANIIVAGIMYKVNKKYTLHFIINSFVSVLLMYFLFGWAIERNLKRTMEKWNVFSKGVKYEIVRYKKNNTFYLSVDLGNDAFQGMEKDRGFVYLRNDTLFFSTVDSNHYFIHDGFIFNFKGTKKERVKKVL
jgi:hypothetical protein